MKKMTRIAALILALLLAASCLAGCQQSQAKTYKVLDENFGAENYAIGFRKEDVALGLEVQKILDEMISDGKAAEISKKWFDSDILLKDADYLEESEAPAGDTSLEDLKKRGELILGLDDSFPPMGFRDEENNVVGFDIDLATEVCKRMGVELKIQPIDWDSKELELSSGRIDCIWNGMSVTDDRLEAMFMAKPYVANTQVIIVPENSDIKTKADLAGKKVGLQKGSSSLEALMKDEATYNAIGEENITQLAENVTVFMDLKAGRIDAFIVDEIVGRYVISHN